MPDPAGAAGPSSNGVDAPDTTPGDSTPAAAAGAPSAAAADGVSADAAALVALDEELDAGLKIDGGLEFDGGLGLDGGLELAAGEPGVAGEARSPDTAVGSPPQGPVPRDAADAGPHEQVLDLGALRLPTEGDVLEGIEIQLQADPQTGVVLALLLVDGPEKALEIRAFAAPRHEPLWDEVRGEIAAEAATAGGLSQAADGRWGTELLVQVGVTLPDGQDAVQLTRFVGVDGPRWFLRGAFLGRAAVEPETAQRLDAILAGTTVVRGDAAMAPRDPLPFIVPGQPASEPAGLDRPPLGPFERGPEITEIR